MIPSFEVPPQYFYALAASMPLDVTTDLRYRLACLADESTLLDQLRKAKDDGIITEDPVVTIEMAARRLRALGSVAGAKPVCASGVGNALVAAYASYKSAPPKATPEEDIAPFWASIFGVPANAPLRAAHLSLIMCAVTLEPDESSLIGHVRSAPPAGLGLTLDDVRNLDAGPWPGPHPPVLDFGDWERVFTQFPADLPAITAPGTTKERIASFVRRLRKFFDVASTGIGPTPTVPGALPMLGTPAFDPIADFFAHYKAQPGQGGFTWGTGFDENAFKTALGLVSLDARARCWLEQAVRALDEVYAITDVGVTDELRFSLAEAVFSRGFTSAADVTGLSLDDFTWAVIGTPAYVHAAAIYAKAGNGGGPVALPPGAFHPINPDDRLVDCVPPPELSPLGTIAYLHSLLQVQTLAKCDPPAACDALDPNAESHALGELVEKRRGPLGDLEVTRANAETPLPVVDIVNECLEAMVATGGTRGVVYDTARTSLAGHRLRGLDEPGDDLKRPYRHDPQALFGALPEHSSPATPVASPNAYSVLASDFSAPSLPYSQALDVDRTYLGAMGATRYEVMRSFRKDITEFVLDPEAPAAPAAFPSHLWRYPVRIELAREYLGINPEEYDLLFTKTPTGDFLAQLYGFPPGDPTWLDTVRLVSEFLQRTGLSYCELVDLWRSGFVKFHVRVLGQRGDEGRMKGVPECPPCYLEHLVLYFDDPADEATALAGLAVFIRLWKKLQALAGAKYTFTELTDIADVLGLRDAAGAILPDFVRQLAAFQILRDAFELELVDIADTSSGTGADRTHLLALWVGPAAKKWGWAVGRLIAHVEHRAMRKHLAKPRRPKFLKLLASNLDPLSRLAGFDPATLNRTWRHRPTHTLRFAEVLAKLYASHFEIGDVLFLFTADPHLGGDDPYMLADPDEAHENPLEAPDDEEHHSLWRLRRKLLDVRPSDEAIASWTWPKIVSALRHELGMPAPAGLDPLVAFASRFFPGVLEAEGMLVAQQARRWAVPLDGSNTAMWNTPDSPFSYDDSGPHGELRVELPLRDEVILTKLSRIRALDPKEVQAVRDLFWLPRADLAALSFLFPSLASAERHLIEEPEEIRRWGFFQRAFARFYARCMVVAKHLADHVEAVTEHQGQHTEKLAWKLLVEMLADENKAKPPPWERDDGTPPNVTWTPPPVGGAFAALVGLVGTGLLGEYSVDDGKTLVWRELRGPFAPFGGTRDEWNAPLPTLLPNISVAELSLTTEQKRWADTRNGIGIAAATGKRLGGAQSYCVTWTGVLLVEEGGTYGFWGGAPSPRGELPDTEHLHGRRFRVKLKRGQKEWILLSHDWEGHGKGAHASLALKRGAYDITIDFVRCATTMDDLEDEHVLHTGFELKYSGPDSNDDLIAIPRHRLYVDKKDDTLAHALRKQVKGVPLAFLDKLYVSTLRDMRRTYQRAFKALLFAHRFDLSAERFADYAQSEIGHMFDHAGAFAGLSFYDAGGWKPHRANFDFDLLPLLDTYRPPLPAADDRVAPSPKREQALFDIWERTFDYTVLRARARKSPEHPVWLLFDEAAQNQPDDPAHLLRHMDVDLTHAGLVLRFWNGFDVTAPDLIDECWAIRVWQADRCIRRLVRSFSLSDVREARPDLWAADAPNNENLAYVVRQGLLENVYVDNPMPRRYEDLARLNDGLRERARTALLAWLCRMDRVPLPWPGAGFVESPKQLSELLLLDVEAGLCERASRVEEAVTAVQTFVQRARLGLEPPWIPSSEFIAFWEGRFASFNVWRACVRRGLYRENWIALEEVESARRTEAFRLLEDQLRRVTLTIPVPGGLEYWNAKELPAHPGLSLLQAREPSGIRRLDGPREGLDLLGRPERSAQRSWLAPVDPSPPASPPARDDRPTGIAHAPTNEPTGRRPIVAAAATNPNSPPVDRATGRPPLWLEAAIRLGVRFVRVSAACIPPAGNLFVPRASAKGDGCCHVCGRPHEAIVDDWYFWLADTRFYEAVEQDADWPGWHDDASLPKLLEWPPKPAVHLNWCRVHDGEVMQPRRSVEGVPVTVGSTPEIELMGRKADSIFLKVQGGVAADAGFRFDLATDDAVALPLVTAPLAPPKFMGLSAYPYFVYFAPGAPLFPLTPFAEAETVAATLRAHCRWEAALKWYAVAWDPLHGDDRWCPGSHDEDRRNGPGATEGPRGTVVLAEPSGEDARPSASRNRRRTRAGTRAANVGAAPVAVLVPDNEGRDRLCCRHAVVPPEIARRRAVTLDYLETLLAWGDCLMKRNSPEAFQKARLVHDTASKILGPTPLRVAVESEPDPEYTVATFVPDGAPLNPRLVALYERVDDRLALIHSCLNERRLANGVPRIDMPYFGDAGVRDGWKSIEGACDPDACCCPGSPYRFLFLVQKAIELTSDVRALGASLLSAFEKGDAEYLAHVRAGHEHQVMTMTRNVREQQWREADWQVKALQKSKEIATSHRQYYATLLANGLVPGELDHQSLTNAAVGSLTNATVMEAVATILGVIPDVFVGTTSFVQLPVGSKLAGVFSGIGRISSIIAQILSTTAGLRQTQAGWQRRDEEWQHQVEIYDLEIEQIERQCLAAERRRAAALRELGIQQQQIENSREVWDILRDKFTSQQLYLWLQRETAALYYETYELARCAVLQAERAFNFERGYTTRKFLAPDTWDDLRQGLLAGERLDLAARSMEKAFLDANSREYELTKHVSLRLCFAHAFLGLKLTGQCIVELPEWLYDLDYPGHYMRRIKSVSLTIPSVVGPYGGVHCRLTLLSSTTRIDPRLSGPVATCCEEEEPPPPPPTCGCWPAAHGAKTKTKTKKAPANGYAPRTDDTRIVKHYAATEAIATSTGQDDTGMFELNFRDERYLPFELAGAVSRWRIELPPENNRFDVDSLSDVVMHVNYTAREGGNVLREAANELAQAQLPDGGRRVFDVKREMPEDWHRFVTSSHCQRFVLRLSRDMFPYIVGRRTVHVTRLELFLEAEGAAPSTHREVEFVVGHHRGCAHADHDEHELQAAAGSAWPGFYHGTVDVHVGPIRGDEREVGTFVFEEPVEHVTRAFLVVHYDVR